MILIITQIQKIKAQPTIIPNNKFILLSSIKRDKTLLKSARTVILDNQGELFKIDFHHN